MRYRFPKDQRLSLAAGLLLCHMLLEEGLDPEHSQIVFSHATKPSLSGYPGWHMNIAHSGQIAACMLGKVPCGVDVESVSSFAAFTLEHILAPDEMDLVTNVGADRPTVLAKLWTRKEAFLKCLGIGLAIDPKEISVHPSRKTLVWQGKPYALQDYCLDGYCLAACLPEHVPFPELQFIGMRDLLVSHS